MYWMPEEKEGNLERIHNFSLEQLGHIIIIWDDL